jgi:hypothetical protein
MAKKKFKKPTPAELQKLIIKAGRKGNRDVEISFSIGFKSTDKIHKSKKQYSRKLKHKKN